MSTKPIIKITAILGGLILFAGAVFHFTGTGLVKGAVAGVESDFLRHALPAMWVMVSVHWIFIACLSIGLSWYRSRACAAMLMGLGLWLLVDALFVFLHVGGFIGGYMLLLAGGLILLSGVLLRRALS